MIDDRAEARYRRLIDELRAEFPGLRLIDKSTSLLQRSIHVALALLTLGGQRRYLTGYVTTLGQRIYLPPGWAAQAAESRYVTMRHERIHVRQFRRWGWLLMGLGYGLLPLPFGLAYFRYRIERAAYEETLRAAFEVWGADVVCSAAFRAHIVAQFTSGAYGWMWPFPASIAAWYDAVLAALLREPSPLPAR